jgi:hypothetical protein
VLIFFHHAISGSRKIGLHTATTFMDAVHRNEGFTGDFYFCLQGRKIRIFSEGGGSMFLLNFGACLQNYTMSHPRIPRLS